jgi:hypothetical protein
MRARVVSLLTALAAASVHADLTKVDADGVTEVGGTAEYSRMLPRTGATGRLDASLLPPVADWASTPIPGLYYVSRAVETEGNGSPQYPFKTLGKAVEASMGRRELDALLFAPGAYSGTITMSGAKAEQFALVGTGNTAFSKLVLESDSATKHSGLVIWNADVAQLVVNVPDTTIFLHNARISDLSGSSTGVKIRRYDMGARVLNASIAYTDSYYGHPTAPQAQALVADDATEPMKLASGRATVGAKTVAYLDDVASATTMVYTAIGEISGDYSSLGDRIATEETARKAGDTALQASIASTKSELEASINKVGDGWNSQLESLSSRITSTDASLAALSTKETNDIAGVNASIEATKKAYASADEAMATKLRNEFKTGMSDTESSIDGIVDSRFSTLIEAETPGIVSKAVDAVNASGGSGGLTNRLNAAESDIASLKTKTTGQAADISNMKLQDTTLAKSISNLETKHSSDTASLKNSISSLQGTVSSNNSSMQTRMVNLESAEGAQNSNIATLQSQVTDILSRLTKLESK